MRHVDDDTLALVALGELEPAAADAEHLRSCGRCREELAALTAVVTAGRDARPLEAPAPHVWDRIAREIESTTPEPATSPAAAPAPDERRPAGPARPDSPTGPAGSASGGPARPTGSTRPAGRRERRRGPWARTAWLAAGIAAGIAGTLVVTNLPGSQEQLAPVVQAQLDPLPGWEGKTGSAHVEEADGRLVLHVEVSGEVADGYREVWLLDEDVQQLVSVGLLVDNAGAFDLPAGLDLGELVIVDVSLEPYDGDPAHSGDSIVRGRLTT